MDATTVAIDAAFSRHKDLFYEVSQEIWKNPEQSFKEVYAHRLLADRLQDLGFSVDRSYVLPTGFKAEFPNHAKGPVVAVICEYDALPDIGHACGHNLIAEAGFAAAVAVKAALEADPSLGGKVVVFGTPAEEGDGGKIHFVKAGAFDNIDVAMMVHPASSNVLFNPFSACKDMTVVFDGKSSHASASPWLAKNALDAAVNAYTSVGLLRQQIRPDYRVGVIISKGGEVHNVIPDRAEMQFGIRTTTTSQLAELVDRVKSCCESGAAAAGCRVKYVEQADAYDSFFHNVPLGLLFKKHADQLGLHFKEYFDSTENGSTDMSNVSQVIPSIHPLYGIGDVSYHTVEFCHTAGTEAAHLITLNVAKSMALTCVDLFKNGKLLKEIREYFLQHKNAN